VSCREWFRECADHKPVVLCKYFLERISESIFSLFVIAMLLSSLTNFSWTVLLLIKIGLNKKYQNCSIRIPIIRSFSLNCGMNFSFRPLHNCSSYWISSYLPPFPIFVSLITYCHVSGVWVTNKDGFWIWWWNLLYLHTSGYSSSQITIWYTIIFFG
jgi:hypothetical protein